MVAQGKSRWNKCWRDSACYYKDLSPLRIQNMQDVEILLLNGVVPDPYKWSKIMGNWGYNHFQWNYHQKFQVTKMQVLSLFLGCVFTYIELII